MGNQIIKVNHHIGNEVSDDNIDNQMRMKYNYCPKMNL